MAAYNPYDHNNAYMLPGNITWQPQPYYTTAASTTSPITITVDPSQMGYVPAPEPPKVEPKTALDWLHQQVEEICELAYI